MTKDKPIIPAVRWNPAYQYEEKYVVSNMGDIYSLKKKIRLKPDVNWGGYVRVGLYRNGKRTNITVHKLVLESFGFIKPNKDSVTRHMDGVRSNNELSNLRWGTPQENSDDMIAHGTSQFGSKSPQAKLTENDVVNILTVYRRYSRHASGYVLAKKYNVHQKTIMRVIQRKTWKHVAVKKALGVGG